MDDLISRAAACDEIGEMIHEYREKGDHSLADALILVRRYVLKQLPAVDAAPVVHARWIVVHGYCTPGGDPVWACSKCGKGLHVFGIEHSTYGSDIADDQWVACPNCGAKMDGERREVK